MIAFVAFIAGIFIGSYYRGRANFFAAYAALAEAEEHLSDARVLNARLLAELDDLRTQHVVH